MTMLKVRDLMTTEVVTVEEDEDLDLAGQLMHLGRVRHLPVVANDRLVGLVTDRDLLKAQASRMGQGPSPDQERAMNRWVKAGWIMTQGVHTVEPDLALAEAAHLMLEHKYGCLPVVEQGKLVGILTEADFVRYTLHTLENPGR
jgi:CBS domain-containing membrane protein